MDNVFEKSIEIVKHYVLRCIDEETLRITDDRDERIELLKAFNLDVKNSDRFIYITTTREVVEVYGSIITDNVIKNFVHGGATFLLMSLGFNDYSALTKHMAQMTILGYSSPTQSKTADYSNLDVVYLDNPWLVFCNLARYTWFTEKTEKDD